MFNPSDYKDELERALYWVSSDQAMEFDDYLKMPIRSRKTLQQHARNYYEIVRKISPDSSISIRFGHFDRFLEHIQKDGEDPDRLLLWLGSIAEYSGEDGLGVGALMTWEDGFVRWCIGKAPLPDDDGLRRLIETYHNEVHEPERQLSKRRKAAGATYMAGPQNRSAWDQYLWEIFYKEVHTDPSMMFSSEINNMLHRCWWRRYRHTVGTEQKEALLGKLAEDISLYGDPETQNWSHVMDIDRAFAVDQMPDFDLYKAGAETSN
ncbi:hypothetical protein [Rhizobium paknamense]|uniref:Uncharacterized protein n=1 Tax=Rhizobium paknamense TaxID=1206817 RepID=A0ABU0IJS4_9HYPH|nr:hypothetical protein [Rhizobium paknamense]MDQ0458474.1 hypothetical protein [Rhizobium paknamense]